ncbi:MAG TPA: hypothetical protein VKC90_02990, partial [Chitinophagaceae bacterium]|nr:hypothetical protein [Chitinophagaceae bacterium]
MKKNWLILLLAIAIIGCNNNRTTPDVSHIKVNLALERFDRDFFAIDSNNVLPGLNNLNEKYPLLTNIFLQNILGLDSTSTLPGVKRFLHQNESISSSVNDVFKNTGWLEKDFTKAFQFVKYYFPAYKLPGKIITVAGPIDALAQTANGQTPDFLGPDFLGLSLQFYLGKNYPIYKDAFFIENIAPEYRSRRFGKEYITADGIQLIVD